MIRRKMRPVAFGDVQIGMAYAASFDLDKHFIGAGRWALGFLDLERLFVFANDGCFHPDASSDEIARYATTFGKVNERTM